jgi:alkanesulfonate monooxygenase SsuD/methylene tetrahydromethanopterin reductase-like flavin-dependent oxidoreductase (luciferase family)
MRFGAAFWIQQTGWPDLRAACFAVEREGWDSIWLDDHLLSDEGDWQNPKLEGWMGLAAVAALIGHVRLGLLVSSTTFRNPGLIAKLATTLDHITDGRAVLGLGGGWFEREHDAFGLDFGSGFGERLDRLDEATMVIRQLLDGDRVTHHGRFFDLEDALCRPYPIQWPLPILIGGSGPTKTLRTAAKYAQLWNGYGDPDRIATTSDLLRERCAEVDRDFDSIERTVTAHIVIRDSRQEARRAWVTTAERHGLVGKVGSDGTDRGLTIGGPPEEVARYLDAYRRIGIGEVMFVFRQPFDIETLERLREVKSELELLAA